MRLAPLVLLLVLPLLADGARGKRFVVRDTGKLYSTLNRTDCIEWPSTAVKRQAGEDAWAGWKPARGERGLAVGSAIHCNDPRTEVVILRLEDGHFIAIGRDGLDPVDGAASPAPATPAPPEPAPVDQLGDLIAKSGNRGKTPAPAPVPPPPPPPAPDRVGGKLSRAQRDSVLREHNRVRADVGVGPLEWSAEIADYAQAWADHLAATSCELHHRSELRRQDGKNYGENLAAQGFSGGDSGWDPGNGVIMWEGEKPHYKGGVIGADWYAAGHYTQVVWRNSKRVGCGVATCSGRGWNWAILACNYDPPGNYSGQKPY